MFQGLNKGIQIAVVLVLLLAGFFVFRYLMPAAAPTPEEKSEAEKGGGQAVEEKTGSTSTPPEQDEQDELDELLKQETQEDEGPALKREIGQMLMIGFRGTEAAENSYIVKAIKDLEIGGVVLFDQDMPSGSFPRNIQNPEQVKKLIAALQNRSNIPLFVSLDAEGGQINRLKEGYGFIKVPSAKEMGQGDVASTEKEAKKLGKQLKDLGFNMNFAPVVDLDINPDNPIISKLDRAFSADPLEVTWHAKSFIEGLRSEGIVPVVKHFPGHGSATTDSHLGLVDVTQTYQPAELFPYHLLQGQNAIDAVMTAHIINRNVDETYPATLSSLFIDDILRKQVGFEGVVISDDMQMAAITEEYGLGEAVVKAINAGCDIILLSNNSASGYDEQLPYEVRDIIAKAVEDGRIPEKRILEAFLRISGLKKQFEIMQ